MKKIDKSVIKTLVSELEDLLKRIDDLDLLLSKNIQNIQKHEHLVSAAYHLSGIYSCFEDIFFKIAKLFENKVENPASWHKELLERMRIDIRDVRPKVIGDDIYPMLDEMRRFRHVFRSSYMFSLKRAQIELLCKEWDENKKRLKNEIVKFVKEIE